MPAPLATGLESYWKLNEALSTDYAADAQGSNILAAQNAPAVGSGIILGARLFSRPSNQRFSLAANASLQTGDIDFFVQAWLKITDKTTYLPFIGRWNDNGVNQREYLAYYDQAADRFGFLVSSNGTAGGAASVLATTFGAPATGTWYLLHGWHDSVNNLIGIDINASAANTTAHSAGVFVSTAETELGGWSSGVSAVHHGALDECFFMKRVPTSGQRTQLYNGGAGMTHAAILADTGSSGAGGRRGSKFGRGFN